MSWRSTRTLVAATATLVVSASAAQAESYPVGSEVFGTAVAASVAHWGGAACGGDVEYRWTTLAPGVLGYATWMQPAGQPADASRFSSCRVDLAADASLSPELFCTVLAHEVGHLHGLVHADDPADLMAEALGDPLPECLAAMRPYMPAPASAPVMESEVAARAEKPKSSKARTRKAKHGKRNRRAKSSGSHRPSRSTAHHA